MEKPIQNSHYENCPTVIAFENNSNGGVDSVFDSQTLTQRITEKLIANLDIKQDSFPAKSLYVLQDPMISNWVFIKQIEIEITS